MVERLRSQAGQAAVEYVAAVAVVAALSAVALLLVGEPRPGADLARTIAGRLLCAVRLADSCRPPESALQLAYGISIAAIVRREAPEVRFENSEFISLPVDPRRCRDRRCADSSEPGRLGRSFEDERAAAFVHVIDCRPEDGERAEGCPKRGEGDLYVQYWLYYPESATAPFGRRGYHRDDWESVQVRIRPDGSVLARASSHRGYNHGADPVSDLGRIGVGALSIDTRKAAWGPASGYVWVSAGSHAGRIAGADGYFRSIPAGRLRLVPAEGSLRSLAGLDFAVTPPWEKPVWRDPEHLGT